MLGKDIRAKGVIPGRKTGNLNPRTGGCFPPSDLSSIKNQTSLRGFEAGVDFGKKIQGAKVLGG